MKKCYCCGAKIEQDNAAFCPKCGKPLEVTPELTRRAAAGDSDAQTELYYRTYAAVYARIRAKVPDDDTAMDLMQDTYLRAFSHLEQLNEPAAFPGWILTIARNLTINWYKKHSKEKTTALFSESEFENEANLSAEDDESASTEYRIDFMPEESLDRAETARLVSEILDELPEEQKIVLLMRYTDEMSIEEIAEELGVSPNTVKTRLLRAKKKVEAKVLELERKGTKLYSLAPLPFLLFLLGNLESQAPNISATQVLSTGAVAGASAGATAGTTATTTAVASAGTTAATTAAATAGGMATKGLAVKIIATLLAVALVGGGAAAYSAYSQAKQAEEDARAAEMLAEEEAQRQAEEEAQRLAEEAEAQRQAEEEAEAQRQAEEEAEAEAQRQAEEEAAAALAAEKQQVEDATLEILNSLSLGAATFMIYGDEGLTASTAIITVAQTMECTYGPFSTTSVVIYSEPSSQHSSAFTLSVECEILSREVFESYLKNIFGNLYTLSDIDTSTSDAIIYTSDDSDILYYPGGNFVSDFKGIVFTILNVSDISEEGIYTVNVKYEFENKDVTNRYFTYYIAKSEVSDYGYAIVNVERTSSLQ